MVNLIGQTLGQYRIIEQIGQGGMATVYKAYQPSLDRYVAIKVLPPYFAHEPGFAMRFTREAKAIARLNHPNILPIYDFGQEQELSYIVMKYVEAGTLKDIMGAPLALDVTADILRQIAGALDHAHQRGILHRDVKPSNVLLDEGRWVLLTDFGLAKMVEGSVALTGSGVGVGTPAYMSPEQGRGEQVDARADIYSLGVVLYEMLTGQVPFQAETPMAVVIKHITDSLPLPRTVNPGIPEAVERVILKALAKNPDDRFASTTEMAEMLEATVATIVQPAPETVEIPAEAPLPAPPPPVSVPSPAEPAPTPSSLPQEPAPVPTPTPPPPETSPPARKPVPWKIVGAVASVILLALAAIFAVSNPGDGEIKEETPTVAAVVTKETATPTPNPEPEPPHPGEELREIAFETVYFKTDFERPFRENLPEGWAINDDGSGNHVLQGKGPGSPLLFPESFEWPEYVLEADLMLAEGVEGYVLVRNSNGQDMALCFGQDLWTLVYLPENKTLDRYKVNNKETWHHLRLVIVEDQLAAFLDDELMFGVETEPSGGAVGFGVHKNSIIFVDNLRISGPTLPPQHTTVELYDDFDQGFLDKARWEWQGATNTASVEVGGGALLFEIENPHPEPSYGELVALNDRPIVQVQADITVERLEGEYTNLVIKLFAERQRMAGVMGENGNVMAFEEKGEMRIVVEGKGLPTRHHLHLILKPEGEMEVIVDGNVVDAVPAPPAAERFSLAYRLDPGCALAGQIDNVKVDYLEKAATPDEPIQASYDCEDELGCVEVPPGKPIPIFYMLDESGIAHSIGLDSLRGLEIAAAQQGEILGHPIELVGRDSACDPEVSQEIAQEIVSLSTELPVVAIIGPTCSTAGWTAAPIISQAGMVMISPSNTRIVLTHPQTHAAGYLRVAPNDKDQGITAAQFAREVLGVERAATLYDENIYSDPLQQWFAQAFEKLGGEITAQEKIDPDIDVHGVLAHVAQTRPDFIFCPFFVETGELVTRLARETEGLEEIFLMGTDDMSTPELLEVAGPAAAGLYLSSPDLSAVGGRYQNFLQEYRRRYNEPPHSPFHAHAFDAAMMVFDAIGRVGVQTKDGVLHIGRQALRDALFDTRGFEGLTGILTCSPYGDCAEPRVSVYQVVSTDPDSWNPGSNPEKVWP